MSDFTGPVHEDTKHEPYDTPTGNRLYTTYQLLKEFDTRVPQTNSNTFNFDMDMRRYFDSTSGHAQRTEEQKVEDDCELLYPFLGEVITAIRGIGNWPVKDELFRDMEVLVNTEEVSFYLIFTVQIFLDIIYALDEAIKDAFLTFLRPKTTIL
ncbi:hypothetical protein EKO27_g6737 [Xylaria grammica]|uniref:Uncharacterized protein n=1 Tax=Xylaria grammica TaxID=363999 RepID=A0A439D1M4_9PEZI|nr:hypothetical protein EKO27_g6737 [Xylaria grammica]